jgi:hypothetical protein
MNTLINISLFYLAVVVIGGAILDKLEEIENAYEFMHK